MVAPQVAMFTFLETEPTDLHEYFEQFKALLVASKTLDKKVSIIVNLQQAKWINLQFVKSKIEFIKQLQAEDLVKNTLKSSAVIFESLFTSWILEMILKFVTTQAPVSSFYNIKDAIEWTNSN